MKISTFLMTAVVVCSATIAQAQTKENSAQVKQDVIMVGGNIGNLRANFQTNANQVQVQLTPRIGWMLRERFMWGVYADFDFQAVENGQTQIRYGAGIFGRAYTGRYDGTGYSKTRLFGEFSSGVGGLNFKTTDNSKPSSSVNGLAVGFGAGLAYFPAQNIGFEFLPRYVLNTGYGSAQARTAFVITFGVNVYLPRHKAIEISKDM